MSSASDPDPTPVSTAATSGEVLKDSDPGGDGHLLTLPPGVMLGGCEVLRLLGAGAYGQVYLGVDAQNRQWAIKRMQLIHKSERKARMRFLQEARILQYARHPNIVMCDGCGAEPDGNLWMRLEYLDGCTLRDLMHREGRMGVERALRLGRQVCQGLHELHKAGGVHRDVKPENLFLLDGDLVKVLDFGLAKFAESACKTTGRIALGTALYFAPDYLERDTAAEGDEPDPRWDVYSVGITLYEMLVGHPFVLALGKMPAMMVAAKMHLNGEIPPLAEHGIPEDVAAVIMKAVARDPARRYANGADFERALGDVHRRRLAEHVRETAPPRTTSAKVRLGDATTEPDVVQQIARGSTLPPRPAFVREAATKEPHEGARGAAPCDVAIPEVAPGSERPPPPPGPELTTRLIVPPAWVGRPLAPTGRLDISGEAPSAGGAPPASTRRLAEDFVIVELPPPPPPLVPLVPLMPLVQHTEPLDRAQLRPGKVLPFVRPGGESIPARVPPSEPPALEQSAVEVEDVPSPLFADEAPLPRDPEARDAAEIAVWLKQGYLPPEVARKLGLKVAPAPAAVATVRAEAPPAKVLDQGAGERDTGARETEARETEARESGAQADPLWPRLLGMAVTVVITGLVTVAVLTTWRPFDWLRGPSVAATAATASSVPSPPGTSATPGEPPLVSSAGSAATSSAAASSSAAPSASATASASVTASAAAPAWIAPKPKSSRANDIYPTLDGDEPGPVPKPAVKAAAPKPAAKSTPSTTATAKKPARKPAGPSPFGDRLDD